MNSTIIVVSIEGMAGYEVFRMMHFMALNMLSRNSNSSQCGFGVYKIVTTSYLVVNNFEDGRSAIGFTSHVQDNYNQNSTVNFILVYRGDPLEDMNKLGVTTSSLPAGKIMN
jgi:hypothetical protein